MGGRFFLLFVAGCGVTYVKGPDGRDNWFQLECRQRQTCEVRAAKECPAGYFVVDAEGGEPEYSPGPANAADGEGDPSAGKRAWLFRCGTSTDRDDFEARGRRAETRHVAVAPAKDLSVCGKAFDNIEELANAWIEWHPGSEAVETLPKRTAFVQLCGELPEEAQFCMAMKYERTHHEDCLQIFDGLPARQKSRLNRLFAR